jgi:hypothetical protein
MTQTVTPEAVREAGNLITVDQAMDILRTTEPMSTVDFRLDGSDRVKFTIPNEWNENIAEVPDGEVTSCRVDINGVEAPLTKEAVMTLASFIGLQQSYVKRTPGSLIEPHFDYWVANQGVAQTDSLKLVRKDDTGVAFVKGSRSVFPNIPVVEKILETARERFQTDEILVDYKLAHSLKRTALRLIVPSVTRTIETRKGQGREDWSLGIQLTNSLQAADDTRLNVSGYLFNWWCTNGSISTHATSGNYNRRVQGQDFDEVLAWVGQSTETIFQDLTLDLNDIEELTRVELTGEVNDVVQDVFRQFNVPVPARDSIMAALVDGDDLTGYGLMQAITQAANNPALTDQVRESTMRIGGAVPGVLSDRCPNCHRLHVN